MVAEQFFYLMRLAIFLFLEADFRIMDVKKGARGRQKMYDAAMEQYVAARGCSAI